MATGMELVDNFESAVDCYRSARKSQFFKEQRKCAGCRIQTTTCIFSDTRLYFICSHCETAYSRTTGMDAYERHIASANGSYGSHACDAKSGIRCFSLKQGLYERSLKYKEKILAYAGLLP